MAKSPSPHSAPVIAMIANLAAAGCFFTIASRVSKGSAGYAIAGGIFALNGLLSFFRWRRVVANNKQNGQA
jgi:hypothetical protein